MHWPRSASGDAEDLLRAGGVGLGGRGRVEEWGRGVGGRGIVFSWEQLLPLLEKSNC